MAPCFAAAGNVAQIVVALLFFLVWIISAIVKSANEQKDQTQPPLPRPKPAQPPLARPRQATIEERAEFLRKQQQQHDSARPARAVVVRPAPAKPVSAKPVAARPVVAATPVPASGELQPRLHSGIEDRHTADLHSRLEHQHLHARAVPAGQELTARPLPISTRGGPLAGLMNRKNLAAAIVLGQVLQPPAGIGGGVPSARDPLGLPPLPR